MNLDDEIASTPLDRIPLGGRARAVTARFRNIGELVSVVGFSRDYPSYWPKTARRDVDRVFDALRNARRVDGSMDCDRFQELVHRSSKGISRAIYFPAYPMGFSDAVAHVPVGGLHLKPRGVNALFAIGITTVPELLKRASKGIQQTREIGYGTANEIRDCLSALRASVRDEGIDWESYAKRRRFTVLPDRKITNVSLSEILAEFTRVGEIASRIQYGQLGAVIFQRLFAQPRDRRATSATIGLQFSKSSGLVRSNAAGMMRMFRQAIWFGDYSGCRFRFRTDFSNQLRFIGESNTRAALITPDYATLLTKPRWPIRVTGESKAGYIIERVRVRKVPPPKTLRMISTIDRATIEPEKPPQETVARLPGTYQYEEILRKSGRPLHYKEIFALSDHKIRPGGKLRERLVPTRLSRDPRFVPLGRSGFWALAEWPNIDTRPVADIMEEVLRDATGPLMTGEIVQGVVARGRPVSRPNIQDILRVDSRFKRALQGGWTL
jgi:Bacterial RNA polymerase, alpha chain C terminal domain.